MAQSVAFSEVISPDQERAQEFYNKLFGWQVAADPATIFTDPDGNQVGLWSCGAAR